MTLYGTYPEQHDVIDDRENRRVIVRNRFYEVIHSTEMGGAISSIRLSKVNRRNLFEKPCSYEMGLEDGARLIAGNCSKVKVDQKKGLLTFESPMRDERGKGSGVILHIEYRHEWGRIAIRQKVVMPRGGLKVKFLLLQNWLVRSELSDVGFRTAAPVEPSCVPGSLNGRIQWKRFSPGCDFEQPFASRFIPRYVCLLDHGRAGLEWLSGSLLSQWDYQLTGSPGHGSVSVSPRGEGISMRICPLDLYRGSIRLSGKYVFDSHIGIPVISGKAHEPFLSRGFNRRHWPALKNIEAWARKGVRTLHFHQDGDYLGDGIFWRDGVYPPFGPDDMRKFDRVIRDCHKCDIKVATYFSNKELHPSTDAYKKHGSEWARSPYDTGQQITNTYGNNVFGIQMCLRSGWLAYLKQYIDTVLTHHDLDGVYYDWNVALYCHNPLHVGKNFGEKGLPLPLGEGRGEGSASGIGGQFNSPLGHWDMDELLDLMAWTRNRVGSDGLVIAHDSCTPMAAIENYADNVVAMEFGYNKLSTAVPPPGALPPEWNFMGSRSRGIITYGCLEKSPTSSLRKQFISRCLLTGVAPWCADDLDLKMFEPLAGTDLSRYRFFDWRSGVVETSSPDVAAAIYAGKSDALLIVGNLTGKRQRVKCRIDPKRFGPSGRQRKMNLEATIAPNDIEFIKIRG